MVGPALVESEPDWQPVPMQAAARTSVVNMLLMMIHPPSSCFISSHSKLGHAVAGLILPAFGDAGTAADSIVALYSADRQEFH
jgi:hypothetical protein